MDVINKFSQLLEDTKNKATSKKEIKNNIIFYDDKNREIVVEEKDEKRIILYKDDHKHEISLITTEITGDLLKESIVKDLKNKRHTIYSFGISFSDKSASKGVFTLIRDNKIIKFGCDHFNKFKNLNKSFINLTKDDIKEIKERTLIIKELYEA